MGLTKPRASQIFDIDYKQATRVITVGDVTLAGGAPSQVDGVNLAEDDRVLVTGQSTASQNGLYFVSAVGTGANGTWVRTSDGNENGEVQAGMIVMVTEGSLYHDTQWKLTTNNPIVIGTTALTFVINILSQIGGSNTQIQYNNAGTMGGSANLTWDGTTLYTNGAVSATGNITGNYILGNGSQLSGIITTVDANTLTGNTLSSNVVTSSLTAVGTLGSLSVTGNVTAGNVSGTNLTGTLTTASQTNITSVGTLGALTVTANTTSGNLLTGGLISATGNITGGNISTAGLISSTGTVTGGNLTTSGSVGIGTSSPSVKFQTVQTIADWTGDFKNYTAGAYGLRIDLSGSSGSQAALQVYTAIGNGMIVRNDGLVGIGTFSLDPSTLLTVAGAISATGAITGAGITGSSLTVSTGNVSTGNIVNNNANGVGNIGSATTYFNTVFAKATSAQYADLAENYEADADYIPGTVVVFGGLKEITVTDNSHNTAVAGVISTNPSYLMNAGQSGEWILPVALTGRVPCRVQGPVNKGTVLVTGDIPGTAMAIDTSKFKPGCVVGKSLEIINSTDVVTIEVAVGRL
jgi:hypothetical protein